MPESRLYIVHHPPFERGGRHEVHIRFESPGRAPLIRDARFAFNVTEAERNEIRWYLEEYPVNLSPPNPDLADQAEQSIQRVGKRLFLALFDNWPHWVRIEEQLADCRVEVTTPHERDWPIPWEKIRNPHTQTCWALSARSFVRVHPNGQFAAIDQLPISDEVRVLLVIARPLEAQDVGFRSVARRLLNALGECNHFRLDLLRPPTFPSLANRLRQAKRDKRPYHILHFDGHGATLDLAGLLAGSSDTETGLAARLGLNARQLSIVYPDKPTPGQRGYLLFENPDHRDNIRLVDGKELGDLLRETQTHLTVLNACRSGYTARTKEETPDTQRRADPDQGARALGSLAQEVMDAGAGGILAMRYNVWVDTAARFVSDLYEQMAAGVSFGEAVSESRRRLRDDPSRDIVAPVDLQDWVTPTAYEATPIRLLVSSAAKPGSGLDRSAAPIGLRQPPVHGFIGRDEAFLTLERVFQSGSVVLLHAYAGSGKTTTATEFARWFARTGGVAGPVLSTRFDRYKPLAQVVDEVGVSILDTVEARFQWSANDSPQQRKQDLLQLFREKPMFWIWDNIELIAGFPLGTPSLWTMDEQHELKAFLDQLQETKAKILLTSRRDEHPWLQDLPIRVEIPPMPMADRFVMARALAKRRASAIPIDKAWYSLLRFTEGNPLTLMVTVGEALRQRWSLAVELDDFAKRLREGAAAFADQESEGRSRSLGASLGYGFDAAFSQDEQKTLSLLNFFQGFLYVGTLVYMGDPENEHLLLELQNATRERLISLLQRAAEIGLLTPGHPDGSFAIHPALPWFFRTRFEKLFPTEEERRVCVRAFVTAMGEVGNTLHGFYGKNRHVAYQLQREEANLLHAFQLAKRHDWHEPLIGIMQGLHILMQHFSRWREWEKRVTDVQSHFMNSDTKVPRPGREAGWDFVMGYLDELAQRKQNWSESESLLKIQLTWHRKRATPFLKKPGILDWEQKNTIRSLAGVLQRMSTVLSRQRKPRSVDRAKCACRLFQRIEDFPAAAKAALSLGQEYQVLPVPDMQQAEAWIQKSLRLYPEADLLGRGLCYVELSKIAWTRREQQQSMATADQKLSDDLWDRSRKAALTALDHVSRHQSQETAPTAPKDFPDGSVNQLATIHNRLGNIYRAVNQGEAIGHYQKAIRYAEQADNLFDAATTRFNVSLMLAQQGDFPKAQLFADVALANFRTHGGERATEMIQETELLISDIRTALAEQAKTTR